MGSLLEKLMRPLCAPYVPLMCNFTTTTNQNRTKTEMKTETKTILEALAYLIDRQGLTPSQIRNIILETLNHES